MAKRALCVGINDYPVAGRDLDGCVNDARAWAALLIDDYGFPRADVKVLLDKRAKRRAIVSGIKRVLAGARADDVLVFTFSGHGTYVADDDVDEPSFDEALVPYDAKDNLVVDDDLRELIADVPSGARLTVVLDSCYSGTGTRLWPGHLGGPARKPRFLPPAEIGHRSIDTRRATRRGGRQSESSMKEVLLSGCSDAQESNDVEFPGGAHGAMTYYALEAIAGARGRISYNALLTKVRSSLRANDFDDQTPQLEGKAANKRRTVFS